MEKAIRQREHVEAKCTKISDNVSSELLLGGRFFSPLVPSTQFPLNAKYRSSMGGNTAQATAALSDQQPDGKSF